MNRRTLKLLLCAILVLWTAAVFLPARHFDFVDWDDYDEVVQNPLLHPPDGQHLAQIWSRPVLRMYTPLSYTTWWTMSQIPAAAGSATWFHLLNIALHLACVILVFSILDCLTKSPVAAFGGGMLFALHPLQVESVGWVAEMNNLQAAAFSLGAIQLFLAFRAAATSGRRWTFAALATLSFAFALLSKPTAVAVPVIVAIVDLGLLRTNWKKTLYVVLPWLGMAAVIGWIARSSQAGVQTALLDRPMVAMDALAFYFGKLIWPGDLSVDYGRAPVRLLHSHLVLADVTTIGVAVVAAWLLWRNYRGVALGALILAAGVLPTLGFVPFQFQEFSTVADRFLYLAMLGPALALASILAGVRARAAFPVAAALGVVLAWVSAVQIHVWQNSQTLVAHTLAEDANSPIGNAIAGAILDRAGRPDQAIAHWAAAVARDPDNPGFRFNLANSMNTFGVQLARHGDRDRAMEQFKNALQVDPHNPAALKNLQILGAGVPKP
jgi:hypothetical protein